MPRLLGSIAGPCAIALGIALMLPAKPAAAALQTVVGTQVTVAGAPVSDCSAKAKTALDSVLTNSSASSDNTQWLAYGPLDNGGATAAASIHCYAVGDGYVATFACAAQIPPNAQTAGQICAKLASAFPASRSGQ